MTKSRARVSTLAALSVAGLSAIGANSASAAPTDNPSPTAAQASTTSRLSSLVRTWAQQGNSFGGGTLADSHGQEIRTILGAGAPATGAVAAVVPDSVPVDPGLPYCTGTFNDNGAAGVSLQESATSIPWGVSLSGANSYLGVVNLSNQTFADNLQQNGYQTHTEPWDYKFHGNLGNPFQVLGGGSHQMTSGSTEVSFLWYWSGTAAPADGGYAYNNCIYDKTVN